MAEHSAGFRVYADATQFERGMAQVTRTAGEVGKKVAGAFDGRAIGRTLATALGLSLTDIADKVARFWTGFSKDAEDALEAMVAATGKAADAQEKALEKLRAKKQKEREDEQQWQWDNAERERQLILRVREEGRQAEAERLEAEAKATSEKKIQIEEGMRAIRLADHERQLAEEKAAIEKKITDEKIKQLEADGQRTALAAAATGGRFLINGKWYEGGKLDPVKAQGASDKELQELIRRRQREISEIEGSKGTGLTALASAASGYIVEGTAIAQLKTDIQRAQYALSERNSIQKAFRFGGESAARSAFGGDPLQFDRLFLQYVDDTRSLKEITAQSNELLRQLNERQRAGIPVVNLNK